jgi:16S rRNA (cytosine1402-N4)-methyltransferase
MEPEAYHVPVLLRESVDALVKNLSGVYVDATLGGGGHTREVLCRLDVNGKLIAFDQDQDAAANVPDDPRVTFIPANFSLLRNHLKFIGIKQVDGVLADLGVSSHQFDIPERGFSIRSEAPLDMRMDRRQMLTAQEVVNGYSCDDLERLLRHYGEFREAKKLANRIVDARATQPIRTTGQLIAVVMPLFREPKKNSMLARVFQALRIEVNRELNALEGLLEQCAEVIRPGGRLVVIAYHSLEDRLVKHFMKCGNAEGVLHKDFFGNPIRPFTPLPGMPVVPSDKEIELNNRARSAKMRIAIKNE